MPRLILLGLNHSTAPLEVREKVAFSSERRQAAVEALRARFPEAEVVILSTCNRVELYFARAVHGHPRSEEVAQFLGEFHQVDAAALRSNMYEKADREAVAHLFSVASSLDSMVLGETQILGQVREAYDAARERGACGSVLNPLFQRAVAVGREVLSGTTIAEGRVSIASVAVDYARQIFDHFADKTVLSIGGGKMASLVLQSLSALSPRRLLVCNRNLDKAQQLAQRFGGEAVSFARLDEHLVAADIVVSSTGSAHPIIAAGEMAALRKAMRYRPIFMIDIALPRDIDPGVGELENVYLYNIDDLQQVVAQTLSQRTGAIEAARGIIERQVEEFIAWQRAREMGPLIERLSKRYHALAAEELSRTVNKLPNLDPAERSHLEELARRIVNKLLHDPITMLRSSEGMHGATSQYLHALEQLFRLEEGEGENQG